MKCWSAILPLAMSLAKPGITVIANLASLRYVELLRCEGALYPFGTNLSEIEFTQCRVSFGVNRSPTNTWPR